MASSNLLISSMPTLMARWSEHFEPAQASNSRVQGWRLNMMV